MRVLLSTIGSRGDVQPLFALALELKAFGHDVRMCVPPDFREWIEGAGIAVTPIGPELRSTGRSKPMAGTTTPEQRRQMIARTVAAQFDTIARAARACDALVGATALQVAAPSVAEQMSILFSISVLEPRTRLARRALVRWRWPSIARSNLAWQAGLGPPPATCARTVRESPPSICVASAECGGVFMNL